MGIRSGKQTSEDRVRVGRDEREQCIEELQEQYGAGRLGDDELSERVAAALTATTRSDLAVLVRDLPCARPRPSVRTEGRAFLLTLVGAAAIGVLGLGAIGLASGASSPEPAESQEQTICLATGEPTGLDRDCPEVSKVQQQILDDADAADRAAEQLREISERNPNAQLDGLVERALASSGRADDAANRSRQIVLVANGEPSDQVMGKAAKSADQAATATQRSLDDALERLDR